MSTAVPQDGPPIVLPPVEIDIYTVRDFEAHLRAAEERSTNGDVIVLMDEVKFLDSSGLGVLVGAFKRAHRRGATVYLVGVPDRLLRTFRITGTTRVFVFLDHLGELPAPQSGAVL